MIASKSPVIFSHFDDLTDPRMDRTKRHLLIDMVIIAPCVRFGYASANARGWSIGVTFSPFIDPAGMLGFLLLTSPERVGFLDGEKHFSEEQIAFVLRQAESGTSVAEIIRKLGISEQTF